MPRCVRSIGPCPAARLGLALALASSAHLGALGAGSLGTSSAVFLKLGSGARPEAMGGAYVAVADDADGIEYNPAGMAQALDGTLQTSYAQWFQGMNYSDFGAQLPLGDGGVLGATYSFLSMPQITRTLQVANGPDPAQNFVNAGTFSPYDTQASVAYAQPLVRGLMVGLNLKFIDQGISGQNTSGIAVDAGLLWNTPIPGLDAGLALQNLGPPMRFDSEAFGLPAIARAGLAYRTLDGKLLLSAEGDTPSDAPAVLAGGLEYSLGGLFYPRVGWRFDGLTNPWSIGLGFRNGPWGLDFCAVPYGELGTTYRVSAQWSFGGPSASLTSPFPYAGEGTPAPMVLGMNAPDRVQTWTLTIAGGPAGEPVKTLQGAGAPPRRLAWDGRDDDGRPVAEGSYRAVLKVEYGHGAPVRSAPLRLQVITRPPVVSLDIAPDSLNPEAPGQAFVPTELRPRVVSGAGLVAWRIDILAADGTVFRSLSGNGPLPQSVVWDGSGQDGSSFTSARVYAARLWVKDALGGEAGTPTPVAFKAVFR